VYFKFQLKYIRLISDLVLISATGMFQARILDDLKIFCLLFLIQNTMTIILSDTVTALTNCKMQPEQKVAPNFQDSEF